MAGSAMGRPVPAPVVRFMIGADRIIGANPQSLQCAPKDMRKSGSGRDESPERALGARAGGVNQYAAAVEIAPSTRPGQSVNPLLQRARRISAFQRDLRHQRMRNAVKQDIRVPGY